MQEKKTLADGIHNKIRNLFLWSAVNKPDYIVGKISEYLEIPIDSIKLREERSVKGDDGEIAYSMYTLLVCDSEFILRFTRKVEEPKEIEVPKVVNKPKKWYQFGEPETEVIIEKQPSKEKPRVYWLLSSVE
jgi:hypothetical protein